MSDDLDGLEQIARAAEAVEPGPWAFNERADAIVSPGRTWPTVVSGGSVGHENASLNAHDDVLEHIATFSPDVVLRLIARIRDLEEYKAEMMSAGDDRDIDG
jgi:hypothetical protein